MKPIITIAIITVIAILVCHKDYTVYTFAGTDRDNYRTYIKECVKWNDRETCNTYYLKNN